MFSGGMYFNTCPKSEQRGGVWRKGDLIDDVPDLRGALVTRDYNSNATEKVWIVLKCLSLIKTMRKKEERQEEDPYRNSSSQRIERRSRRVKEGERPVNVRETTIKDMTLATFHSGIGFQGRTPSVSVIGSP
jgi:hypothetical protein